MSSTKKPKGPNPKSNSKSQTLIFWKPPKFWLKAILVMFVIEIIFDLLIGGNIRMYAAWTVCDQKPVAAQGAGFSIIDNTKTSGYAHVPAYSEPYIFTPIQPSKFYCTPREAEMHGYSASNQSYEFNHLTDDEARDVYYKYLKP